MIVVSARVAIVLALSPQMSATEGLLAASARNHDGALVAAVKERQGEVRPAFSVALDSATRASSLERRNDYLKRAHRLAFAYAVVWHDRFFIDQLARFQKWSERQRATKLQADGLRRAGNDALDQIGAAAAMAHWRRSEALSRTVPDSVGIAASLGNLGAGFYRAGDLDSAEWYLQRSRKMASSVGDSHTALNALGTLGLLFLDRGDAKRAKAFYKEALPLRLGIGDREGEVSDHNNLGLVAEYLEDYSQARREYLLAVHLAAKYGLSKSSALSLSNLGNVLLVEGKDVPALRAYHTALDTYRRLGDRFGEASVLDNLAKAELSHGAYASAEPLLLEALVLFDSLGAEPERVTVRRDLVVAYTGLGNPEAARLEGMRLPLYVSGRRPPPSLVADLDLTAADLAIQFNSFEEAQRRYTAAAQLYASVSNRSGLTEAQRGLGLLALSEEDFAGAEQLFLKIVRADSEAGNLRYESRSRIFLAYAQRNRGAVLPASRSLRRVIRDSHLLGDWAGEAAALGALGDLEVESHNLEAAESTYRSGLRILRRGTEPQIAWNLHASLGTLLRQRGNDEAASTELRSAVSEIEEMANHLSIEDRRSAFLGDKWNPYGELAIAELAQGHVSAALAVSERLRSQQLLAELERGQLLSESETGPNPIANERHLDAHIASLAASLHGDAAENLVSHSQMEKRTLVALNAAKDRYRAMLPGLERREPAYGTVIRRRPLNWKEIAAKLKPDEALIEYLVTDSTTVAFVVTSSSVRGVDLGITHATLRSKVDLARSLLADPRTRETVVWRPVLSGLFVNLIQPIETLGALNGVHKLVIVPHAELHYLPFGALLKPGLVGRFLIEDYEIELTPSAAIWSRFRSSADPRVPPRILAIAPQPELLPGALNEVVAIRRWFGRTVDVWVGADATRKRLQESARIYSIIHIASAGQFNKENPFLSFVGIRESNGEYSQLRANEIIRLRLSAGLVVLSACETALGSGNLADVPPGDDWVGLVQAFLQAGASHVLATLWRVDDRATAQFMVSFYGNLREGRSQSASVASAQRTALHIPALASPYYWAGFTLSGIR